MLVIYQIMYRMQMYHIGTVHALLRLINYGIITVLPFTNAGWCDCDVKLGNWGHNVSAQLQPDSAFKPFFPKLEFEISEFLTSYEA